MTQEEKELLLKDLCARLPYGVKGIITYNGDKNIFTIKGIFNILFLSDTECCNVEDFKPYLFPLSSMTEEQKQYLKNRFCSEWDGEPYDLWKYQIEIGDTDELIDWLNKSHFDYRVLIEKGLAIDATGLNIY